MAMFTKNKDKNDETEKAIADDAEQAVASEAVADEAAVADEESLAETGAAIADEPENADPDEDDEDEDEDEDEDDGDSDGLDLDLMDIFEAEQNETTSTAGIYAEFLEDLTMEEVLDQATMLLDEIRAKLGS